MRQYFFRINLSFKECEALYQPGVNTAIIHSECGKRIRLPVLNLRSFVSGIGVKGRFRLQVNEQNKVVSFERVS